MITLENWISKPVVTVNPDDSVFLAVKKMVKKGIGDVVVVNDKKKPIGIVTERDILKRAIIEKKDLNDINVKSIMTKKLKTVDINTSLLNVSRTMKSGGFRRLPVTKAGKLVGIITSRDLVRFMSL